MKNKMIITLILIITGVFLVMFSFNTTPSGDLFQGDSVKNIYERYEFLLICFIVGALMTIMGTISLIVFLYKVLICKSKLNKPAN